VSDTPQGDDGPDRTAAFWDAAAATYDDEVDHGLRDPVAREAWRALLAEALPTGPCLVADLACGTGTLTELLAEAGHDVHGVDLSAAMVALARAKTARFGPAVRIERGDASSPPLPPGSFDVVLGRHIVWALPDPRAALRTWVSLLRPGGRLVLVEGVWGVPSGSAPPSSPVRWRAGVPAAELAAYLLGLEPVEAVDVRALDAPAYWGHPVGDERYRLVATLRDVPAQVDG